jgi:hypothetical protein
MPRIFFQVQSMQTRGRIVSNVHAVFDLVLLSTNSNTHLCMESGTLFPLDLAFCSPGLAAHLWWLILRDLHGSDQYCVNLHIFTTFPLEPQHETHWLGSFLTDTFENREFLVYPLHEITAQWVPSTRPHCVLVRWWTDMCHLMVLWSF